MESLEGEMSLAVLRVTRPFWSRERVDAVVVARRGYRRTPAAGPVWLISPAKTGRNYGNMETNQDGSSGHLVIWSFEMRVVNRRRAWSVARKASMRENGKCGQRWPAIALDLRGEVKLMWSGNGVGHPGVRVDRVEV